MHVPQIIEAKEKFEQLKQQGLIDQWELPYENLLTRRSAAIFFFTPNDERKLSKISEALSAFENFSFRENTELRLSKLKYRVTFSKEEKEKNESINSAAIQ